MSIGQSEKEIIGFCSVLMVPAKPLSSRCSRVTIPNHFRKISVFLEGGEVQERHYSIFRLKSDTSHLSYITIFRRIGLGKMLFFRDSAVLLRHLKHLLRSSRANIQL